MEMVIVDGVDAGAAAAADVIEHHLRGDPSPVLGLATGSTAVPIYAQLVDRHRHHGLSFARARLFMLDEYVGLPPDDPHRFGHVLRRQLCDRVDLPADALRGPDVDSDDLSAAAAAYEDEIVAAGGVDLQLLGIGVNGHVGFNEPGSPLRSRTRVVTLTDQTVHDNARFFGTAADVPRRAVTQGLGTICEARHLLLVAFGPSKTPAVAAALEGPVSPACPASIVRGHRSTTVVLDADAARELRRGGTR